MEIVRKMKERDIPVCAGILAKAYGQAPYFERFLPEVAIEYMRSRFGFCHSSSFVLESEGQIVGFLLASISVWTSGKQAIIEEIVMDPEFQGRGYGKNLMKKVEKSLKESGVVSLILWSRKDSPAHGFHLGNGFTDSKDWVIMDKNLETD